MTTPTDDAWRRAGAAEAVALRDLERRANLVGLGHVFGERPFPDTDVLHRWQVTLLERDTVVEVVDGPDGLVAAYACDRTSLRHLAVHPDHWGRGWGAAAVRRAQAAGARRLWVLEPNHRARGLYESLGWQPTGITQPCPWDPHPVELDYVATADTDG